MQWQRHAGCRQDPRGLEFASTRQARAAADPVALHAALIDLVASALAWAELSGSD